MRKLKRLVAKYKAKKAGYTRFLSHRGCGHSGSWFSLNWRKILKKNYI